MIYQTYQKHHIETSYRNVYLFLIPKKSKIIDLLYFIKNAVHKGIEINAIHGINVINASEPFGAGVSAAILKFLLRKRTLLNIQGEVFGYPTSTHKWYKRKLSYFISKLVALLSDRVRCLSQKIYRQAIQAGIPKEKLFYSPSRCDTHRFNPMSTTEERRSIRKSYGFSENLVVIFVGALLFDKGILEFLEAFRILQRRHSEIRAMVIGNGPLKGKIKRVIAEQELEGHVAICGHIDHSKLPGYLSAADIFIFPSKHEAMPRAVLEAMAMELPVVASSVGGIPEIIREGETGMLVKNGNPEEIVKKVEILLSDRSFGIKLGKNARKFVMRKYEFHQNAKKIVNINLEMIVPQVKKRAFSLPPKSEGV